jgi:hypothetical protein
MFGLWRNLRSNGLEDANQRKKDPDIGTPGGHDRPVDLRVL